MLKPLAIIASLLAAALGCGTLMAGRSSTEGSFSHRFHLEAIADLKCDTCHNPLDAMPSGKYMSLIEMDMCVKCHDPARSKDLRVNIEKFLIPRQVGAYDHGKHAKHSPMQCLACHAGVDRKDATRAHVVPTMETCWTCHAKVKTFEGESGARCALCHSTQDYRATPEKTRIFAEVIEKRTPPSEVPAEVMPPAHAKLLGALWLGEIDPELVPRDHTENFKKSLHGRISEAPEAKCYACHWQKECGECHTTTRPSDHTLRFERSTHGRLSLERPESCAACHHADSCDACHRTPPPGHTQAFRTTGAHAAQARAGTRSCLTCHKFDETCSRCHNR